MNMSAEEKKRLIDQLTETHLATRKLLNDVDLEMVIYADSGWQVRDILGHIATWDLEVAKSLQAYKEGSEYIISDLDEEEVEYNQSAVDAQKALSDEQLLNEWVRSFTELRDAVQALPYELFPGDMAYPWGDERGTITTLVEYMIEHSDEHREEIIKAVQEN